MYFVLCLVFVFGVGQDLVNLSGADGRTWKEESEPFLEGAVVNKTLCRCCSATPHLLPVLSLLQTFLHFQSLQRV